MKKEPKLDIKTKLSLLWIFAVLNYLYADILTLMDSSVLNEFITGTVGGMQITPMFLFIGAILMETAIVMVIVSRFVKYRWNRIANIASGILHTLAVGSSMFVGTLKLYYGFFAVIEIGTTIAIVSATKAPKRQKMGVPSRRT